MAPRRPVVIACCSAANTDPGDYMYTQAISGPVDVITGDYLAEANLATSAEAYNAGTHPGYVPSALDGLQKSLKTIAERKIKVIINGGSLNPKGLAMQTAKEIESQGLRGLLKVAWVEGDDLLGVVSELLQPDEKGRLPHLDAANPSVQLPDITTSFLNHSDKVIVSANAYLGWRAIHAGLQAGADIVICGRVADASPVIGASAWWHNWADSDFDALAGALVAGHLIECNQYVTGANFSGFDEYPTAELIDLAPPIAEIDSRGQCIICKHESLPGGLVTEETVKSQLVYELQGNIYLNSDVKADLTEVRVRKVGNNRVQVTDVRGYPPPPSTKLAVFYKSGYQGELNLQAVGYATPKKWELAEAQLRNQLQKEDLLKDIDLLEFQQVGVPEENPKSQLRATTFLRIFVQAAQAATIKKVWEAWMYNLIQHFAGASFPLDLRSLSDPAPYLGYFPATVQQDRIKELVCVLDESGHVQTTAVGPPRLTEPLSPRMSYDPIEPQSLESFGPVRMVPAGDVLLARSGDKGANCNVGFFPRARLNNDETWEWLRAFMTMNRVKEMMGPMEWKDWYHIERVEFPNIRTAQLLQATEQDASLPQSTSLPRDSPAFGGNEGPDTFLDVPQESLPGLDFDMGTFDFDDVSLSTAIDMSVFEPDFLLGETRLNTDSQWDQSPTINVAHIGLCDLSHLTSEDISYLSLKKCFELPSREVQDKLVEAYFTYIHPFLPFLAEDQFWSEYDHDLKHTSFLVYRAMLFAGSPFIDTQVLKQWGFDSHSNAQESLYHKARFLFDFGTEKNEMHSPRKGIDWLDVALSKARTISARFRTSPKSFGEGTKMVKRLLWSCTIRDTVLTLGCRGYDVMQSNMIDVPMLLLQDLDDPKSYSRVYGSDSKQSLIKMAIMVAELTRLSNKCRPLQLLSATSRDLSHGVEPWVRDRLLAIERASYDMAMWKQAFVANLSNFINPPGSMVKNMVLFHQNVALGLHSTIDYRNACLDTLQAAKFRCHGLHAPLAILEAVVHSLY
ncbi:DUF1446 domain protein [Fusarium sp. NRRL 52700]|nr:DUF1446 domain protein [Fusarium sp. NRRL 52700]